MGILCRNIKIQIVIIDKQLSACFRNFTTYHNGRIIHCTFEVARGESANFISVYGFPHYLGLHPDDENDHLQNMAALQRELKSILAKALRNHETIFVFGDLQDTPDTSSAFHYGTCRINKHPLGIINACEEFGLICTIYQHMHSMNLPIVSRHGTKGGRYIDGMYTTTQALIHITGITIVQDTGIPSDHDMILSKIDLGIRKFQISKDKEERIDYRQILNIPVFTPNGQHHPTLSETIYHGDNYRHHKDLYTRIQTTINDPKHEFLGQIKRVQRNLEELKQTIITRTQNTITPGDQLAGKLVQRLPEDALNLNNASEQLFSIIQDICRKVGLATMVPVLPTASITKKKLAFANEKIIPGIASVPISKQVDDSIKRTRSLYQRLRLTLRAILRHKKLQQHNTQWHPSLQGVFSRMHRLANQIDPFRKSIIKTIHICKQTADDRLSHVNAIQHARNKKIFDNLNEDQDFAIEHQGIQEYNTFIAATKQAVFQNNLPPAPASNTQVPSTKSDTLAKGLSKWDGMIKFQCPPTPKDINHSLIAVWLEQCTKAKKILQNILHTTKLVRTEEWKNAKKTLHSNWKIW